MLPLRKKKRAFTQDCNWQMNKCTLRRSSVCCATLLTAAANRWNIQSPQKAPPWISATKTHQRMAQKHASVLAANTITTIFVGNQSWWGSIPLLSWWLKYFKGLMCRHPIRILSGGCDFPEWICQTLSKFRMPQNGTATKCPLKKCCNRPILTAQGLFSAEKYKIGSAVIGFSWDGNIRRGDLVGAWIGLCSDYFWQRQQQKTVERSWSSKANTSTTPISMWFRAYLSWNLWLGCFSSVSQQIKSVCRLAKLMRTRISVKALPTHPEIEQRQSPA